MKRIVLAFIILMVMILPSYGADTAMNALGDVSGSLTSSHYAVGYKSTTAYRFTMASILGLKIGTVTNTDLCVGDAGGLIQCTVAPTTYLASIGGTLTGVLVATTPAAGASGYASIRLPHGAAPTTNITNGDCWTTTAGLYCYINGSTVGPYATGVGAGDVTDVGDCSSGACLDGSSDGGTYVRLYDGSSAYTSITAGVRTLTFLPSNANAENLVVTFGDNTNVVALSSSTGATVNVTGTAANVSGTPALPDGTTATKQAAHSNDTKLATDSYADALVSDTAYDASSWDTVQYIAPSKNAVRDYIESRIPGGADGSYRLVIPNNTAIAATASVNEIYPEANVWKFNENGTERSRVAGPTAGPVTIAGPTQARTLTIADADQTLLSKAQTFTQCTTIKDPLATSDYNVYITPVAIHVTATHCLLTGATNIAGQFDIADTSGASPAYVDSADMTCTTTISNDVALNGTVAAGAGAVIQWRSTSVSGTPTALIACFNYTLD